MWSLERFFFFSSPFPDESASDMDRSTRSYASEFGGKSQVCTILMHLVLFLTFPHPLLTHFSQYGGSQKSTHGVEIDEEGMEKRRVLEHQLVTKYDKTAINPREECW